MAIERGRDEALGLLMEELKSLPESEIWRVRVYAGLRHIVYDQHAAGLGLVDFLTDESSPAAAVFTLLNAKSLAALDATRKHWRTLPQWSEHWFLLGVQNFGKHRRLVPPGRFERFDEAMLSPGVNWHARYLNFVRAKNCPNIESLRLAAVRVAQSLDIETSGVEEVRRRLATELQLGDQHFLSIECVEQLLDDASSLRSAGGGLPDHGDNMADDATTSVA